MAEACKTKAGRYYNGVAFCVIEMKLKSGDDRADMDNDNAGGINAGIDDYEISSDCGNKRALRRKLLFIFFYQNICCWYSKEPSH